jgi:hypothetical protein
MPSFIPEIPLFARGTHTVSHVAGTGLILQLCFFFVGPLFRAEKLA